ncbi:hypothetical protein Tco_0988035 [Tanacetum coccineum]|uniref:Uncharacterized protein n=1 Tax=Tanacetum coccineum TaxID=301880 RepID=A0ABQ5EPU9_9ASTR
MKAAGQGMNAMTMHSAGDDTESDLPLNTKKPMVEIDQNAVEYDDKVAVVLANLLENLKLMLMKIKRFKKSNLKKAKHIIAHELKECKSVLAETSRIWRNDSFTFVHELKQEMHADLKYVESFENEIDELESKAEFSNMYDILLQECVSNDVMCSYLHSLSDLDAHSEFACLYLHKVKEYDVHAQKLSELKKLIEKMKEKSVDTNFGKPSILGKPPLQPNITSVMNGNPSRVNIKQLCSRSYALSWKPCQGDSLNLPDHRYKRRCCSLIPVESNSLPHAHAHAQTTKTYYKHQDSRIKKAHELKTKTFANSDTQDLP